ncbi:hypothetical protein BB560_003330 [Smittium megazygosporum]|uniref:Sec1-like protein n=1 Tax=Smittium megazygosporum TaxID=133381 RepID=A0A2T9ZCB1_9FUNG|nr:hypothetical protein BB560_003330 [Smittium megazygosporum]
MLSQVVGMKILLLDKETTGLLSVVSTQTYLLSKDTYLVDKLENTKRETMKHLKCIVFIRPSDSSITSLAQELLNPKYESYYIFFSNTIKKSVLETLAEHDEFEVVREIQEFYADYFAVLPNMYSLGMISENYPSVYRSDIWDDVSLTRATQGLMSLFLSLKTKPFMIRYEANSNLGRQLAKELSVYRKNDPLTPLLKQWTYLAMIHDLFGINNGRVDLSNVIGIRPEYKEIVLSTEQDEFLRKSVHLNFGDLGISIKDYVNSFQQASQTNQKLESIADMKSFVENYPEFRKLSGNISELEQSLACTERFQADYNGLKDIINNNKIRFEEKLCCALIFILRNEKSQPQIISELKGLLINVGFSAEILQFELEFEKIIDLLLDYAGYRKRQGDLFKNENLFSRGKSVIRGLKGVDNVYTQHTSNYIETLVNLVRGRQSTKIDNMLPIYPGYKSESSNMDNSGMNKNTTNSRQMMMNNGPLSNQTIIVFFVGGVTFAEEADISKFKAETLESNVELIIGGTDIINIKIFMNQIAQT